MDIGNISPLLKFIAAYLPTSLYPTVLTLVSHLFATATTISRLWNSLFSQTPTATGWNIHAFLPAIITILAAYLALASLYRTTSWVFRTSFWFIKWSIIISILLTGMSYYTGNDVAVENRGIIPDIGRYVINMANGGQGSEDWRRVKSRQKRKQKSQRPKVWESFERLREWQQQQVNDAPVQGEQLMSMIAGAADHVLEKSEWWTAVKNIWGNSEEDSQDGSSKNTNRGKSRTGKSRSR
jgi:hypothetical protein